MAVPHTWTKRERNSITKRALAAAGALGLISRRSSVSFHKTISLIWAAAGPSQGVGGVRFNK
jgi:hypothetical protein